MSEELVFSFLLVVRNEEKYIANLLDAILNQDFPHSAYQRLLWWMVIQQTKPSKL